MSCAVPPCSETLPSTVVPTEKVINPVAANGPTTLGLTSAVNIAMFPLGDGLTVSVVIVACWLTV